MTCEIIETKFITVFIYWETLIRDYQFQIIEITLQRVSTAVICTNPHKKGAKHKTQQHSSNIHVFQTLVVESCDG